MFSCVVASIPSEDLNGKARGANDKLEEDSLSLCVFRSEEFKRCLKCKKEYILD